MGAYVVGGHHIIYMRASGKRNLLISRRQTSFTPFSALSRVNKNIRRIDNGSSGG